MEKPYPLRNYMASARSNPGKSSTKPHKKQIGPGKQRLKLPHHSPNIRSPVFKKHGSYPPTQDSYGKALKIFALAFLAGELQVPGNKITI